MISRIYKKLIFSFKISKELGGTLLSQAKIFIYSFILPRIKKLKKPVNLKIKKFGKTFSFDLENIYEFLLLKEIFFDEAYDISPKKEAEVILDLGSNIGLSVLYFRLKYPEAKIYAFEPDPNTFTKLEKNIKGFSGIRIFQQAVSGESGKIKFYSYPKSISSSLKQRFEGGNEILVEAKKLDDILEDLNLEKIDIIKYDVEGAELDIFQNFEKLSLVGRLIGELHLGLTEGSKEDFLSIFKNFSNKEIQLNKDKFIIESIRKN